MTEREGRLFLLPPTAAAATAASTAAIPSSTFTTANFLRHPLSSLPSSFFCYCLSKNLRLFPFFLFFASDGKGEEDGEAEGAFYSEGGEEREKMRRRKMLAKKKRSKRMERNELCVQDSVLSYLALRGVLLFQQRKCKKKNMRGKAAPLLCQSVSAHEKRRWLLQYSMA